MPEEISRWLASHSLAVQAAAAIAGVLLTAALVFTTIRYVRITTRILEESRKTREAAEKEATASQENLQLLKQQYESQLGLGPKIVREAILDTRFLVQYWIEQAGHIAHPPHGNPDPSALMTSSLVGAVGHARRISDECAELLLHANACLRNAKSELEKEYQTARHQTFTFEVTGTAGATTYLQKADAFLEKALLIVSECEKTSDSAPR